MRNVIAAAGLALAAPALVAAQQPAPSGEAVYRQHCAGCHEGNMPRLPSREALRALTPEHIETAPGGMVFVSSGYGSLGFMAGNVLLALSPDGR